MQNQNQLRTDIEKLIVLLPYWISHNSDHIRDQEKWLKKAEKEGLIEVADELKKAIDHSKKGNRHAVERKTDPWEIINTCLARCRPAGSGGLWVLI
jgi:hypothetical protein